MKRMGRLALAAGLLAAVAVPVEAQRYRFDFGVNGGYSYYTAMLGSDETGLGDATTGEDVRFDAGPLAGAQITFWLSDRIGLRANATYADRPVVADDVELIDHVNLWSGTGDLMFRFKVPNEEWMGTEFLPYLALGIGGKWHNPAGDDFTCSDPQESETWACAPFSVGTGADQTNWALGEQKVLAGLVGLGADVRLSPRFALRLEANDRMYKPQVYSADLPDNGDVNLPDGDEVESKLVHEIGGQVGLHLLMGLRQPQAVAVAPAPAPAPPPAPAPEPPPPPREDNITVCVIDPTATGGIRMQQAVFVHDSGDTLVVVNGNRVPLNQAVGTVAVARDADWYVRGAPLNVTIGNQTWEFVTYGGATMVQSNDLAFLGTVNGMPVYANAAEIQDVREELDEARAARADGDFAKILEENQDLREDLDDLRILYVPLETTGCVFQPVQRQEEVRKSGRN